MHVGILGIHFKTADLALHEIIARSSLALFQDKSSTSVVLLSTCNRTEIYFSSPNLLSAKNELFALLQADAGIPLSDCLYSYFEKDCFAHLCRVIAGLDSAIFLETDIVRQVKIAYASACSRFVLPGALHYLFQKSFKIAKSIRNHFLQTGSFFVLFDTLWNIAEAEFSDLRQRRIFLVGHSEIHRRLADFFTRKGVKDLTFCSRHPEHVLGIEARGREALSSWREYDVISCATQADTFLIRGSVPDHKKHLIFDLSVPRNVDPSVESESVKLFNMAQINRLIVQNKDPLILEMAETFLEENVSRLSYLYREKISKFSVAGESGEGDDIANIFHSRHKKDEPFKAKAKSRVRDRAIFSEF